MTSQADQLRFLVASSRDAELSDALLVAQLKCILEADSNVDILVAIQNAFEARERIKQLSDDLWAAKGFISKIAKEAKDACG